MRKSLFIAALSAAIVGTALAQIGGTSASASGVYLLDVDPARYAGPAGQRLAVRIDDAPRRVALGDSDEICVQLRRLGNDEAIMARVRALRPEAHDAADVRIGAKDISPGTYRSTPWGMLLRLVPAQAPSSADARPLGTDNAPVCTL